MRYTTIGAAIVAAGFLGAVAGLGHNATPRPAPKPAPSAAEAKANMIEVRRAMLQQHVLASLKDPTSAELGPIVYRGDNVFCGAVRAKNSFGAMVNNVFVAVGDDVYWPVDGSYLVSGQSYWNAYCK